MAEVEAEVEAEEEGEAEGEAEETEGEEEGRGDLLRRRCRRRANRDGNVIALAWSSVRTCTSSKRRINDRVGRPGGRFRGCSRNRPTIPGESR